MYNRYIGNTGKFVRVDDSAFGGMRQGNRMTQGAPPRTSAPIPASEGKAGFPVPSSPASKSKSPLLGLLGGGGGLFNGLLGGKGGGLPGKSSGGLSGLFDRLPFGLDMGDILLFLLLLFFFLESGDEEFLIILGFIVFSVIKDNKALLA